MIWMLFLSQSCTIPLSRPHHFYRDGPKSNPVSYLRSAVVKPVIFPGFADFLSRQSASRHRSDCRCCPVSSSPLCHEIMKELNRGRPLLLWHQYRTVFKLNCISLSPVSATGRRTACSRPAPGPTQNITMPYSSILGTRCIASEIRAESSVTWIAIKVGGERSSASERRSLT